jgi:nicotinamide riboside transporter PnuC
MRCWCEAWALWLGAALIDIIFFAQALTGSSLDRRARRQ